MAALIAGLLRTSVAFVQQAAAGASDESFPITVSLKPITPLIGTPVVFTGTTLPLMNTQIFSAAICQAACNA